MLLCCWLFRLLKSTLWLLCFRMLLHLLDCFLLDLRGLTSFLLCHPLHNMGS
jgi:hypothetical protein